MLCPKRKPFSVPLSCTSAHPMHVHVNWPLAWMHKLRSWCTDRYAGEALAEEFVKRFELVCAPPWRIAALRLSLCANVGAVVQKDPRTREQSPPPSRPCRLILPFHPSWDERRLRSALRCFSLDPWWRAAWQAAWACQDAPSPVALAWQVNLPRTLHYVYRQCLSVHE